MTKLHTAGAALVGKPTLVTRPLVIGFAGRAGAGKSYAADYLIKRYGFERIKMAAPLKDMLRAVGMTEAEIEGDLKEIPSDELCGKTPRHAMQTLGTEWGRNCIGEDVWVNMWLRKAATALRVVCDDVRFANEAAAVRSLGGHVVFVDRGGWVAPVTHQSEEFEFRADSTLLNGGGPEFDAVLDQMVWSLLDAGG